jgi:hypothetical protein
VAAALKPLLPWLFLLGALGVSLMLINGTAPAACNEVPRAFTDGVQTEVGGDDLGLYSSCRVTNAAGEVEDEETQVNWSGLLAALGLCVGAWCLGAIFVGRLDPRRGALILLASALLTAAALAAFFV